MILILRLLVGLALTSLLGACHGTLHSSAIVQSAIHCEFCAAQPQSLQEVQRDLEQIKYTPLYSGTNEMQKVDKTTQLWFKFALEQEYKDISIEEFRFRYE